MMKRLRLYILFTLLMLCTQAVMAAERSTTLVYTGNLNGELEPCGCAVETDLGGILRRASMIQTLRSKHPDMFLLSSGGLLSSNSPRDRLKGLYILKGMATMKYDAIGVQWRDLAYGSDFINSIDMPWISSNWYDDQFEKMSVIKRSKMSLAVFNWMDPRKAPQRQMQGKHKAVSKNTDALRKRLEQSREQGHINVLLSAMKLKKARKKLPLDLVDILFIKPKNEEYGEPVMHESTLVLQPGTRGMRMARLDLVLDSNGRIKSFGQEVFKLPKSVPDADYLASWYEEYNSRVKQEYEKSVAMKKKMSTGESPYGGEEVCKTCHANAYQAWQQSKHARAFEQLEAVNKAYDPDCIGCHTVGFEQPGGYIDSNITSHLMNVQCESCHGAARDHATSGGSRPVGNKSWQKQQMCAQCHKGSHSPNFDIQTYWPKIAHGH